MTELERQLTATLERLSALYEVEQRRPSGQVEALRRRVERQTEENEALQRQVEQLSGQGDALGRVLQDARREVAWPLDLTRQRRPGRDHGPSR